jgi:hypothetical protein
MSEPDVIIFNLFRNRDYEFKNIEFIKEHKKFYKKSNIAFQPIIEKLI